jgi:hypothetical protein
MRRGDKRQGRKRHPGAGGDKKRYIGNTVGHTGRSATVVPTRKG